MPKKISFYDFQNRFKAAHPYEDVSILNYHAVSKPVDIKCNVCGKIHHYQNGNRAVVEYSCCASKAAQKKELIKEWLAENEEFDFVKDLDSETILIKHNKCENIYKRNIQKFFSCPGACSYCDSKTNKLALPIEDARAVLEEKFNSQIQLVEYFESHTRCKYRCVKCGQIFTQRFDRLLESRGCPKCSRKALLE
jgi:DNA-directed RNA polymerase subunit RPC12/RpoP